MIVNKQKRINSLKTTQVQNCFFLPARLLVNSVLSYLLQQKSNVSGEVTYQIQEFLSGVDGHFVL